MLRIVQASHTGNAKSYHEGMHEHEDEYTGAERARGVWQGKGADLLGLSGKIRQRDWEAMCDNLHPGTGESLTGRNRADRTVAYDFNYNCPKSVSIMASLGGDTRIEPVFRAAMRETMQDCQRDAETRVRRGGEAKNRVTGNLVWGEYVHYTARPVKGQSDMHLHGHSFVFNATLDPVEDIVKAVQFRNLKRHAGYYEALFLSRLAAGVRELGYDIRTKGRFWEIDGVPDRLVEEFSQRTQHINKVAAERGIVDPESKAKLGPRTRQGKASEMSDAGHFAGWEARMKPGDAERLRACRKDRTGRFVGGDRSALEVARHAMGRVFERSAVVSERKLVAEAVRLSWDHTRIPELQAAFDTLGLIRREVDGDVQVTTQAVLREEERLAKLASDGRNWYRPISKTPVPEGKYGLGEDQLRMVNHVLGSRDFITLVAGGAGTGKTKALQAIDKEITLAMSLVGLVLPDRLITLAPTACASRDVLRENGFREANTVAKFLMDTEGMCIARDLGEKALGRVVVIDEANMLGTADMLAVAERTRQMGGRLVLLYDPAQHKSVARGNIASILKDHAGLDPASVQEVQRQSGKYKEAVEAFTAGRAKEGFSRLNAMGAVKEVVREELPKVAARDYVDSTKANVNTALIAPTHAVAKEVAREVRALLKADKTLKRERSFVQYKQVESTPEDRSQPELYKKGQMVQFHQNCRGFKAGTRLNVTGGALGSVVGLDGVLPYVLPLHRSGSFLVYEKGMVEVAVGDRIRITRNTKVYSIWDIVGNQFRDQKPYPTHDLNNGSTHRVKRFTRSGDIQLENNLVIPRDFGHIDHGYCSTSNGAQGRTVGRVIAIEPTDSGPAASMEQFYTAITRGRDSVAVYTDNAGWLREAVQHRSSPMGAMDLMKARQDRVNECINRDREEASAREQEQFSQRSHGGTERERQHS